MAKKSKTLKNATKKTEFAVLESTKIILMGVIAGLGLAIALILQQPIQTLVEQTGVTDPTLNSLLTILIYFLFAVILVIFLMFVTAKQKKYK